MTRRTPSTQPDSLAGLRDELRAFARARDWEQFHTPKNLAMALAIEAAEVMEHFQWLTADESRTLSPERRKALGHEIADVLIYLTRLADVADIDPVAAARTKIAINAQRYPVETAHGNALKHDELPARRTAVRRRPRARPAR